MNRTCLRPGLGFALASTASVALATASINSPVQAQPLSDEPLAQATTVSDLSDVRPTDWAYSALRALVEDYDCLDGYPDGTFRGDRVITRDEFAAVLAACLDATTTLIGAGADPHIIARLRDAFQTELSQVDALEARIDALEANQFSANTRLFGQVIFGLQNRGANQADFFPVDGTPEANDPGTNLNFITNAQLSLVTQLNPRGLLLLGLQTGQGSSFPALTNEVRLGYEGDTNYTVVVSDLTYRHLIGDSFGVIVGASGVSPVNVFRGANRIESAGSGPLSALAQRNPVINIGRGNAGLGFDWQIAERVSLQGVYAAANASQPNGNGGLFQGDNTLGFQLTLAPTDTLDVAFHYVNTYSDTGVLFTGNGDDQITNGDGIVTHGLGATAAWQLSPSITLGTWGGYTSSVTPGEVGVVNTTNWMVFLNFPDLFGEGNLGGIYIGQPPKIVNSTLRPGQNIPNLLAGGIGAPGGQPGTTTHIELFYRHQVTDNLSITPGLIMLFQPAHSPASESFAIGAIRTTFTF